MDSQDLGHDRPDKTTKVKDDANGQRSQGHRETREVDRTTTHSLEQHQLAELPPLLPKETSEKASREPSSPSKVRLVVEELTLAALAFGKTRTCHGICVSIFGMQESIPLERVLFLKVFLHWNQELKWVLLLPPF